MWYTKQEINIIALRKWKKKRNEHSKGETCRTALEKWTVWCGEVNNPNAVKALLIRATKLFINEWVSAVKLKRTQKTGEQIRENHPHHLYNKENGWIGKKKWNVWIIEAQQKGKMKADAMNSLAEWRSNNGVKGWNVQKSKISRTENGKLKRKYDETTKRGRKSYNRWDKQNGKINCVVQWMRQKRTE